MTQKAREAMEDLWRRYTLKSHVVSVLLDEYMLPMLRKLCGVCEPCDLKGAEERVKSLIAEKPGWTWLRGLSEYSVVSGLHYTLVEATNDNLRKGNYEHWVEVRRHLFAKVLQLFLPMLPYRDDIIRELGTYDTLATLREDQPNLVQETGLTEENVKWVLDIIKHLLGDLVEDDEFISGILDTHGVYTGPKHDSKHWFSGPNLGENGRIHVLGRWQGDGASGYETHEFFWPVAVCGHISERTFTTSGKLWEEYDERPPREKMCPDCLRSLVIMFRILGPRPENGYYLIDRDYPIDPPDLPPSLYDKGRGIEYLISG